MVAGGGEPVMTGVIAHLRGKPSYFFIEVLPFTASGRRAVSCCKQLLLVFGEGSRFPSSSSSLRHEMSLQWRHCNLQMHIIRTTELAAAQDRLIDMEKQNDDIMRSCSPAALLDKLQSYYSEQ
ncbi:hypothetical protein C2845_PM01G05520 [Panicum miliaceum]|uniref:Uncharacterized protein n=1 Tax=Panicum miliaceum TaxID=4540 RepID=A0A3L6THU2_PANMI|nr:hypothetical protein C2845_PM01G05520 [Panicum miliaceum]